MSELHTNTDTDADKYILNGVEVTPNEVIETITIFLQKQQFRVGRLNARTAELEAENAELKERVAMLDVTAVYKSLGEMGYIEQVANFKAENAALQSRIAELEAESERFTVHSDIERQDDNYSNHTQTDAVVYGKDSKPMPCPFCGGTNICTEKGINLNYCDSCSAEANIEHWNTRPIEDELRARIMEIQSRIIDAMAERVVLLIESGNTIGRMESRIAELEAEIDIRKDQLREAKNILIDKKLQIDSLYEEGYKLQQRIAELEAEIDQLTAHSDIERKVDKSPNDTQTQTIVYRKESEE